MHNKISDYSILETLQANGTETWRVGNQTVCRCPICKGDNDKKAGHNAQVNIESNTIFCHSEGITYTRTVLINALNLREKLNIKPYDPNRPVCNVLPAPKPEPVRKKEKPAIAPEPKKKEISKKIEYTYKDLSGKTLYFRDRIEYVDGGKDVQYRGKPADQRPIFYGLETLADPENISYIILAEGAKCANAVRQALADTPAATDTAALGFDKASEFEYIGPEAQKIILSKNIIIFADNDLTGRKNTAELTQKLASAKSLTVVDFYDRTAGYDIADWIESYGGKGGIRDALAQYGRRIDLSKIKQATPEATQRKEQLVFASFTDDNKNKTVFELLNEVRPELILGKFYKKTLSVIAGNSGSGKTYISIQQCMQAALTGKKALLWPAEDIGFMGQRLKETLNFMSYDKNQAQKINENFTVRYEIARPIFIKEYGRKKDSEAVEWFVNFINYYGLDLLILDSFNRFSSGLQENMPSEIGEFMNTWHEIALKTNCAVVFLHHLNQSGLALSTKDDDAVKQAAIRGAGSILATSRANFIFLSDKKVKNKKYLQAANSSNYLPCGKIEEYYMPFADGANDDNDFAVNNETDEEETQWQDVV